MGMFFIRKSSMLGRKSYFKVLLMTVFLLFAACSEDTIDDGIGDLLPGYSQNQTGGLYAHSYYIIYQLSGDYSDNVPVSFDVVVIGKNGEREIYGRIVGIPDNRKDGLSPVHKLDEGFYYSGAWGQSPRHVYLSLKYSDYVTTDDLDKADRPEKYGYAVIPEARVTLSYRIEQAEFWKKAEELYPEDKEKYGPYWKNTFIDTFDKTMNRLIADGLPGFELIYDETTYDPATDKI